MREPEAKGTPGYSSRSFSRYGTPPNGPLGGPERTRSRARSKHGAQTAASWGLNRSVRVMAASTRSVAEAWPERMSSAVPIPSRDANASFASLAAGRAPAAIAATAAPAVLKKSRRDGSRSGARRCSLRLPMGMGSLPDIVRRGPAPGAHPGSPAARSAPFVWRGRCHFSPWLLEMSWRTGWPARIVAAPLESEAGRFPSTP